MLMLRCFFAGSGEGRPLKKIESVEQINDGYWLIKLIQIEQEQELNSLTSYFINEIGETASLLTLGNFLNAMGEHRKAEQYYKMLLDTLPPDDNDLAIVYNNLGMVYETMRKFDMALEYFERANKLLSTGYNLNQNSLQIAKCYQNIGSAHMEKGDFDLASKTFQKALEIEQNYSLTNDLSIATTYNGLGLLYTEKHDHELAIQYFEKALAVQMNQLPSNHPDFSAVYNNIGSVYSAKKDYKQALNYYRKALEVGLRSLPPDHPDIVKYGNNIGIVVKLVETDQ
ncbi:unnamed protein product [Didymodactylos carnosus]|uniref:Tetratricopeptide repeat protein n=1 Tax=Didymodactylos carnosus TaxID=1234261 RepID=A0A8S2FRG4_9BILA|nr:unnamed protein product [Didymodactylos carnosus]CAF4332294.1 unnamed protein product [Didymodactylos carnosus]